MTVVLASAGKQACSADRTCAPDVDQYV